MYTVRPRFYSFILSLHLAVSLSLSLCICLSALRVRLNTDVSNMVKSLSVVVFYIPFFIVVVLLEKPNIDFTFGSNNLSEVNLTNVIFTWFFDCCYKQSLHIISS